MKSWSSLQRLGVILTLLFGLLVIISACSSPQGQTPSVTPTPSVTLAPTSADFQTPHPDRICLIPQGYQPMESEKFDIRVGGIYYGYLYSKNGLLALYGSDGVLQGSQTINAYSDPPFKTRVVITNSKSNKVVSALYVVVCNGGTFILQVDATPEKPSIT